MGGYASLRWSFESILYTICKSNINLAFEFGYHEALDVVEVTGDGVPVDMLVMLVMEEHLQLPKGRNFLLFCNLTQLFQPVPYGVKGADVRRSSYEVYA